jgi:methionyl aminopeptidase
MSSKATTKTYKKNMMMNNKMAKINKLIRITQECLYIGIKKVRPGAYLEHIGAAIQIHAEKHGFSVVRDYCGHGIGRNFHEAPQVLHYRKNLTSRDARFNTLTPLVPGMIFTIEPMINAGKKDTKEVPDDYPNNQVHAAVTADGSLSAQFEHTILVTETGYEVLTLRAEESGAI